jgi:hypothetical protein
VGRRREKKLWHDVGNYENKAAVMYRVVGGREKFSICCVCELISFSPRFSHFPQHRNSVPSLSMGNYLLYIAQSHFMEKLQVIFEGEKFFHH